MGQPLSEKILVVDDEPLNRCLLQHMLHNRYSIDVAEDGKQAIEKARHSVPDLILLDLKLPDINGFDVCRVLKNDPDTREIPVIFITVTSDSASESRAFHAGAVDFIAKPFSPAVVRSRIEVHLASSARQQDLKTMLIDKDRELEESRLEIVSRLAMATELKDYGTGLHITRVSRFAYYIALAAGLAEAEARMIETIAPLHDIGKIGIPDHILHKPGPLDEKEWEMLRSHCKFGYQLIGDHGNELLRNAAICAYSHHERWDGTGYPCETGGEDIPLAARILAVADVFDALICERPYKRAWAPPDAVMEIFNCAGSQFDPAIVRAFIAALPEIMTVVAESVE